MSQTVEVRKYAIAKPWRGITESDRLKLGPRVQEAFIQTLEGGPDLVYYRQKPHAGWVPIYTIIAKRKPDSAGYSIGDTINVEGLDLIAMMIDGKIAHYAVIEAQFMFLGNKVEALGQCLSRHAETLDGLSPYFRGVPSTGEDLLKEVETLEKLDKARARLEKGNISEKDIELFWLRKSN